MLYTGTPVTNEAKDDQILENYEQRWRIEEFHKVMKTGCGVESRKLQTGERLERLVAVSSVVATRLLQLKTAALQTPERPARDLVPARWIKVLLILRDRPEAPDLTIREFVRHMACLGGFLGRKHDGEPGWITIWRGYTKLEAAVRLDRKLNPKLG